MMKLVRDRSVFANTGTKKSRIPINLSWKNITYSVVVKKERKCILNDICGKVDEGTLCAIMGPSGSGKTTLLNILSNTVIANKNSKLTGNVIINGTDRQNLGRSSFRNLIGIVRQHNALHSQQTVFETLMTAAKFNSEIATQNDREQLVQQTLSELDLLDISHTRIGDDVSRGISGGEKKRLVIGMELIRNPSLILLDEPTSGLDSFQSLKVLETLKKLCNNGCTVILSIHQARSSIYNLFDTIFLLSHNGHTAYHGKSGDVALEYFKQKGFVCPNYFNPADFFLDVISVDSRSEKARNESILQISELIKEFDQRVLIKEAIESNTNTNTNTNRFSNFKKSNFEKVSIFQQLSILSVRSFRQIVRSKRSFITRFVATLVTAFLSSAVYSELNGSIFNRQFLFGYISMMQILGGTVQVIPIFFLEKLIVRREMQTKSYSLIMYYITTLASTMFFQLVYPVMLAAILYYIVGLKSDISTFAVYLLITMLNNFAAIGLGFLCSGLPLTLRAVSLIGQNLAGIMILFSGFFMHVSKMPDWLSWISYFSVTRWSYMAYCINEFKNEEFQCPSRDGAAGCLFEGENVLQTLEYNEYNLEYPIVALLLLLVLMHFCALLILKRSTTKYMDLQNDETIDNTQSHISVQIANNISTD